MTDTPRKDGPRTEALEWLVWFARKSKGTVAEVTQRALEQNPYLRAEAAAGPRDDGLREAAEAVVRESSFKADGTPGAYPSAAAIVDLRAALAAPDWPLPLQEARIIDIVGDDLILEASSDQERRASGEPRRDDVAGSGERLDVERLARALQETILTSIDEYRGPGMGAYRIPWNALTERQRRHVRQDAEALVEAYEETR